MQNHTRKIELVDVDSYVGRINRLQNNHNRNISNTATADIYRSILNQSVQFGYVAPTTPGADNKFDVNALAASHTSFKSPYQMALAQSRE